MNASNIIWLMVAFQIKHFLADYPLQTKYMLGKFKDMKWEKPLLAHVGVHAIFTFLITCWFGVGHAVCFAIIDATTHFLMDRFKADSRYLGQFKSLTAETVKSATPEQWKSNNYYWWSIGFDQLIHGLTTTFIVWWMAAY